MEDSLKMSDREKVIKGIQECDLNGGLIGNCPYKAILLLLKEQEARIKKYEYLFDFLGIGFREWATKILDGEAEAICEADEYEHKTVITFKLI